MVKDENNINKQYGVYDSNSREIVEGTEEELMNAGFNYICGSKKAAYRRIFIMLTEEELKSDIGLMIEKEAYADNFEHAPEDYKPGYFIKKRLEENRKNG